MSATHKSPLEGATPVSEQVVRQTARIMGENSAAAMALRDADVRRARGEEVAFFQGAASLYVVKVGTLNGGDAGAGRDDGRTSGESKGNS